MINRAATGSIEIAPHHRDVLGFKLGNYMSSHRALEAANTTLFTGPDPAGTRIKSIHATL